MDNIHLHPHTQDPEMLASIQEVEESKAAGVYWYASRLRILIHTTDT